MFTLLKKVKEKKEFDERTTLKREEEVAKHQETDDNLPPLFNRRLFAANSTVVITPAARGIMGQNAEHCQSATYRPSASQLAKLRCVVDGMKMIHHGMDYIKDVLSHVVVLETYEPFTYVNKQPHETALPCYYIVRGLVEVTYDFSCGEKAMQVFEPNIIYTHGSGEYLGLVSHEGQTRDMAPPSTVYTKEECSMIRIDRSQFHRILARTREHLAKETWTHLNSGRCALNDLSPDDKRKLIPSLLKQVIGPNKVIVEQDEPTEYIYFIVEGNCQCCRLVNLEDTDTSILFHMARLEAGDVLGEDALEDTPSHCTVYTITTTVCYRVHRDELETIGREQTWRLLSHRFPEYPADEDLMDAGYKRSAWQRFQKHQMKLFRNKDQVVRPLALPIDVRWGTITENVQRTRELLDFLEDCSLNKRKIAPVTSPASMIDDRDVALEVRQSSVGFTEPSIPGSASPSSAVQSRRQKGSPLERRRRISKSAPPIRRAKSAHKEETAAVPTNGNGNKPFARAHTASPSRSRVSEEVSNAEHMMSQGQLGNMGTKDIVKQAKVLAEEYSRKVADRRSNRSPDTDSWCTSIHAANREARNHMVFTRFRLEVVRRRLERAKQPVRELQKKKEKRCKSAT